MSSRDGAAPAAGSDALARFVRHRAAVGGAALIALLACVAVLAPVLTTQTHRRRRTW